MVERGGPPLTTAVSAANTPDAAVLLPLLDGMPAVSGRVGRPRRRPDKLHADKAYDHSALRAEVRRRGITVRIARKKVESSQRLGRHRWVIERTMSWLMRYRRLVRRYAEHFAAFATIACVLICYRKLVKQPK
jgi:transposase